MKRIFLQLTAALSLCGLAWTATRPRFGGSLSVEMRGSIGSFDLRPSGSADDDLLRDTLASCVCDRLVTLDADGDPRPALSTSWRSERDGRSWYFTLRKGVTFHSGFALTAQMAVAPLATANPNWHVRAEGDAVLIQSDTPISDLLYELAESRNSICLAGEGHWIGSGPFQITDFRAGQFVELKAFDQSWPGRPFLDSLRFEMGNRLTDQALDAALSHTDLMQGDASETSARTQSESTEPIELLALAFSPNRSSPADLRLRKAIALTIDRSSIFTVLLRRKGEAGAGLLPEWISGYAHLFDASQNLLEAKRLFSLANSRGALSVGYDPTDPTAKLVAERLAVNAREAGITMQPVAQTNLRVSTADATIARIRLESANSTAALTGLGLLPHMTSLQKAPLQATAESLYGLETDALKDYTLVPIAHVPEIFTTSQRVHDFRMNRWGEINWGNLWTEPPQ